ncbi:putative E3 ubiquitin-protein ligase [Morus notabilis]|uniref:RBR-type E3 ubiquitin transferase n=1 Tax=Morus notabilis TaxID=981085 RepID=W9RVX8_9ROSA|nr:E3 ubiquitin-protein ligase RNF144A [Morus notabilis]EXC13603.1 putative E3 ubiquitin-protein ligase [Morus notabilis]
MSLTPTIEVAKAAEEISSSERGGRGRKKPKMEDQQVHEIIDLEAEEENDDDDGKKMRKRFSKKGINKSDPISVEQYLEERDLHLAIMASLATNSPNFIDLSEESAENQLLWFDSQETSKNETPRFEMGQSSNSKNDPSFVCEICIEPKSSNESFSIKGCSHSYCTDCVFKYVASKLQDNVTAINCPVSGCDGWLEPEHCRSILPAEVFDRWGFALCEAFFLASEKFYCPYKDCSVMLINDGGEAVTQSECPNCYRMFCAECKVSWHEGISCEEFRKLNKDEREKEDIMLMNLATSKLWRRCPSCRFYVERSEGCLFMRCRCGVAFCYNCGNSLQNNGPHYCSKCRR